MKRDWLVALGFVAFAAVAAWVYVEAWFIHGPGYIGL